MLNDAPIITFYKAIRTAPPIRPAEASAAGSLPAAALQYCEAMRVASAFGHYVYPPEDISLTFDGQEVFQHDQDQWVPLKSVKMNGPFRRDWVRSAPPEYRDSDPAYLTELPVPGIVQIWSGYFVSTAPGWASLIRPPVNYTNRSSFKAFEGIIETDEFAPCPLFINLSLSKTDREIFISRDRPLFQICPILKESYALSRRRAVTIDVHEKPESFDWPGLDRTVRQTGDHGRRPGEYAVARRKR